MHKLQDRSEGCDGGSHHHRANDDMNIFILPKSLVSINRENCIRAPLVRTLTLVGQPYDVGSAIPRRYALGSADIGE
jgi:hypothetical protein